jgi:hypothetical protein
MKQACVIAWNKILFEGYDRVAQVASIHDEYQFVAPQEISESIGTILVCAIQEAGQTFAFRCALDGEFRVGANWAETH